MRAIEAKSFSGMLIKFSSVAVATIATMPPKLSAICIASPSEMWSSVVWLGYR